MQRRVSRRAFLAATGTAALAGCTGGAPDGSANDASTTTSPTTSAAAGGPPTVDEQLPLPLEPATLRERAVSGGPPKDGIPSIDDPSFHAASDASHVDPNDPVFGLSTDSTARAYPRDILAQHEICNDVVDGTPVSVTYCPLTGTAMGFERGDTTFGVSGRLVNNNLIMYDRATETWWPQVLSTSIPGPWNGDPEIRSLRQFRVVWTTWERWRSKHPDTDVLSRNTGFARNYDRDPYGSYNPRGGYYAPDSSPLFNSLSDDDRLQTKTVVIGARTPDGAFAVEKNALREDGLVEGTLGETPVVVPYGEALDTGYVYRNPDETAFEYRDGSVESTAGELYAPDELPLDRVLAFDAMWFAWSGFYPDTGLYART